MTAVICHSCAAEVPAGFKFCGACGAKLAEGVSNTPVLPSAPPQTASNRSAVNTKPAIRDEFRDVTVLFADVTGFTAMSEKLDPETVHAIMNECFEGLGRIVQTHGGHIDKYIGDSIMALFGAPTAHEDDPVRAAETAIAMQQFLADFAQRHAGHAGGNFKMRIGLNSGLVLAGSIGSEGRRDYSVMGDAVNIAARLESMARPGSILVSADLKRRIETAFSFGPAVLLKLKGKDREIEAFELLGEDGASAARTAAPASSQPFIGRAREREVIQDHLNRALSQRATEPVWIEIRGPVGIGKTRLADVALMGRRRSGTLRIVSRPATRMRPFALARRIIYAICQKFSPSQRLPETRAGFAASLAPVARGLEPYLNALWYMAAPDALGLKTPDPDPLTFRRTVDRGLAMLLSNVSATDPGLVLLLDAYDLSDTETQSFFESARNGDQQAGPSVIATVRGEDAPAKQASVTITLDRLDEAEAAELLGILEVRNAKGALSAELKRDILDRADGVPLFLEELVRKVAEDRTSNTDGDVSNVSGGHAALPNSLLGVMISRLDRLETATRDLLSQCSVQGVEFSSAVASNIWSLRGGDGAVIPAILSALEARHHIQHHDESGERWSFSQVLMQNACYDSMLKRDRRTLHRDVASALIASSGGAQAVSAEVLANHYELSEQWMEAARQNLRSGDRAAEIFANAEALARYARALKAVREHGLDGTNERFAVYAGHRGAARVHLRVGNYLDVETSAQFMRNAADAGIAEAEADRLEALGRLHRGDTDAAASLLAVARAKVPADGDPCGREVAGQILYDLADLSYRQGRNIAARELIRDCRNLLSDTPAQTLRLDILEGRVAHTEGRFQDAVRLYEQAYEGAAKAGSLSEEALSSNYMGNAARDVGKYEQAEGFFNRALEIWQRTGLTESIAGAHNNLANLAISRGDPGRAQFHYSAAQDAFGKIGNAAGTALALTNLAILAIETGAFEDAVEKASQAKAELVKSGNKVLLGLCAVVRGEALLEAGCRDDAAAEFGWVLGAFDASNHPLAIAGAERGMGRVALESRSPAKAIAALERALALYTRLAREQEAARTELYLARACQLAGLAADAQTRLENARRRFKAIGAIHDLDRAGKFLLGS